MAKFSREPRLGPARFRLEYGESCGELRPRRARKKANFNGAAVGLPAGRHQNPAPPLAGPDRAWSREWWVPKSTRCNQPRPTSASACLLIAEGIKEHTRPSSGVNGDRVGVPLHAYSMHAAKTGRDCQDWQGCQATDPTAHASAAPPRGRRNKPHIRLLSSAAAFGLSYESFSSHPYCAAPAEAPNLAPSARTARLAMVSSVS